MGNFVNCVGSPCRLLTLSSLSCHLVILDHWIGAQRPFAVKVFYKNKNKNSVVATSIEFCRHFKNDFAAIGRHDTDPPAHGIITLP